MKLTISIVGHTLDDIDRVLSEIRHLKNRGFRTTSEAALEGSFYNHADGIGHSLHTRFFFHLTGTEVDYYRTRDRKTGELSKSQHSQLDTSIMELNDRYEWVPFDASHQEVTLEEIDFPKIQGARPDQVIFDDVGNTQDKE